MPANIARPPGKLTSKAEVSEAGSRLARAISTGGASKAVGLAACEVIRRAEYLPSDETILQVHEMEAVLGMPHRPFWVTEAGVCLDPKPRKQGDFDGYGRNTGLTHTRGK